jgi:hypothetical protein
MLSRGYSIMRNLENATPEGVTDIQPVNLVPAPFGPRRGLIFIRTELRPSSVRSHESRHLLDVGRMVELIRCLCKYSKALLMHIGQYLWVTGPYNLPLMSRPFRCYI